ncbi:hypothetical protein Tco_0919107 [Tanacetum coccineum]
MELCTNLQQRVLDLETTKTTQANEITSLKRRVKKLKRRNKSRTHRLKRIYRFGSSRRVESSKDEGLGEEDASKQGRIANIDANKDIYLVNVHTNEDMFDVNDLDGDEVIVDNANTIPVSAATTITTTTATITDVEVTLAQALTELKSAKPKAVKVVIQEPSVPVSASSTKVSDATTTTTATIPTPRKGIVITELEEPMNKFSKKKDLIRLNGEIDSKLQAEFDEEDRLAREKDEANVALTEEWDDIQAKKMFDRAFKRVNTFVDFRTDLVKGSSKRAGDELEQEVTKKQKVDDVQETVEVDDDQETTKIKELMKFFSYEEEVVIDAIPIGYLCSKHC